LRHSPEKPGGKFIARPPMPAGFSLVWRRLRKNLGIPAIRDVSDSKR
jgi:hypothetical protein